MATTTSDKKEQKTKAGKRSIKGSPAPAKPKKKGFTRLDKDQELGNVLAELATVHADAGEVSPAVQQDRRRGPRGGACLCGRIFAVAVMLLGALLTVAGTSVVHGAQAVASATAALLADQPPAPPQAPPPP
eukprot:7378532-Prymnesium_polylepis.1